MVEWKAAKWRVFSFTAGVWKRGRNKILRKCFLLLLRACAVN